MWGWTVLKHWAELSLAISVWRMFEGKSVTDAWAVLRDGGDVSRLGIVTIVCLSVSGVVGMIKTAIHGFRLPAAMRLLHRLFRALRTSLATWRRKPGRRRPGGQDR